MSLLDILSKVSNLEGLGQGGKALVEEAMRQAGATLKELETTQKDRDEAIRKRDTYKQERDEARAKGSDADSELLESFKKLGDPASLSKRLSEAEELKERLFAKEQEEGIREAGYDPVLLVPHLGRATLKVVKDGDSKKELVSFTENGETKETPFSEWAASKGLDTRLERMRLESEAAPTGRGDLKPPVTDHVGEYLKRKGAKHGN